jgi:hypothetical protein
MLTGGYTWSKCCIRMSSPFPYSLWSANEKITPTPLTLEDLPDFDTSEETYFLCSPPTSTSSSFDSPILQSPSLPSPPKSTPLYHPRTTKLYPPQSTPPLLSPTLAHPLSQNVCPNKQPITHVLDTPETPSPTLSSSIKGYIQPGESTPNTPLFVRSTALQRKEEVLLSPQ